MIVQRQAILAGVALGVKSLYSGEYLEQIRDEAKQADQGAGARVKNVIIVDDQGNIKDSLDKNQNPQWNPDKSIRFVMVKDISLPPLNSALGLPPDNTPLPEGMNVVPESRAGSAGAFYFPVETEKGRRYVIVVFDSANNMSAVPCLYACRIAGDDLFDGDRRLAVHPADQIVVDSGAACCRR